LLSIASIFITPVISMLSMFTIVTATVVMQILSQSLCVLHISIVRSIKIEVSVLGGIQWQNLRN